MRGIFISYRRDDAEGQAGRLFDDLSAHFGDDAVFMDVAGIKKGLDFRRIIDEHIASCAVLLVIIGKRWLGAADAKGRRRLDDPNDFVRLETAAALSRDIPVVPVLVHDAVMPAEDELPGPLKELAFRNGTELTHARWDSDVKLLIDDLRPYLDSTRAVVVPNEKHLRAPVTSAPSTQLDVTRSKRSWWIAGAAAMGLLGAAGGFAFNLDSDTPTQVTQNAPTPVAKIPEPPSPKPVDPMPAKSKAAEPAPAPSPAPSAAPSIDEAQAAAKQQADKAAAAKAAAERAARAEAARKAAEEKRAREEAAAAQLAYQQQQLDAQRRRDEEAQKALADKKLAEQEKKLAEQQKLAADQQAGAQVFATIAGAILGQQMQRRR